MAAVMTAILLFIVPNVTNALNINNLEQQQLECIEMAYNEGNKIELYGTVWGETVASIAYQESWCNSSRWQTNGLVVGDLNKKGKPRSLGIMQVRLSTAKYVNRKYPHIFKEKYGNRKPKDEELIVDLLIDNRFNIKVGVHYYMSMLKLKNGKWSDSILAYNRGPNGKGDPNDYVRRVKKWRKEVILKVIRRLYDGKD